MLSFRPAGLHSQSKWQQHLYVSSLLSMSLNIHGNQTLFYLSNSCQRQVVCKFMKALKSRSSNAPPARCCCFGQASQNTAATPTNIDHLLQNKWNRGYRFSKSESLPKEIVCLNMNFWNTSTQVFRTTTKIHGQCPIFCLWCAVGCLLR